jgi:hypothetical protein
MYINKDDFLEEYIKSRHQDDINSNLRFIFKTIINKSILKINISEEDKKIYNWYINKKLDDCWINYDPNKNVDPIPYYNQVINNLLVKTYKNIKNIRQDYWLEEIVKKRKLKLNKLLKI